MVWLGVGDGEGELVVGLTVPMACSVRYGPETDFQNCIIVHNEVKAFEGNMSVRYELTPKLFNGVTWSSVPNDANIIQGQASQYLMTIQEQYWVNTKALDMYVWGCGVV